MSPILAGSAWTKALQPANRRTAVTEKKPAARRPTAKQQREQDHQDRVDSGQAHQAEENRSNPGENVGPAEVAAQPDASMGNEVQVDAAQQGGSSRGGEENTNPHPGNEPSNFREHRKAGK
jgi:hypothetical protein